MPTDMPLFPLNSVLFPGMPISLHIFEDRYKLMMNTCITEKVPFGVVLISEGLEALGPLAEPYKIGCSAQITEVQPLGGGRMNLSAMGTDRFRILEMDRDSQPYLTGRVEVEPLQKSNTEQLDEHAQRLRPEVIRYLEILSTAGDVQFDRERIPTGAMSLANFSAFLIRVEAATKQGLLEAESEYQFLRKVMSLYKRENALLQTMIAQSERDASDGNPGPFSLN